MVIVYLWTTVSRSRTAILRLMLLSGLIYTVLFCGADFAAVRRVLETHCVACHNGPRRTMGLDVTTLRGLKKGGSRGPAVVPGRPEDSAAYLMMESGGMPPNGPRVSPAEVELFRKWIEAGAHWPAGVVLRGRSKTVIDQSR
ncbi:MAG TPA: hypothetical protein DEQ47_07440 [Solibacterales bacterium]|nr:hypothetical protein [Bryobacterales bacterium]